MKESLNELLEQVARRGSWVGGGSAAALTAALAAALLEKLVVRPHTGTQLRRVRHECARLVQEDAARFARVIHALRSRNRAQFRHALHRATQVQKTVRRHARTIDGTCRTAQRSVPANLQSDLRCARALARAAEQSANTLIATNRAWLRDHAAD